MDKDRIAEAAKKIKGSIKETIGKATGDAKLEAEGKADKVVDPERYRRSQGRAEEVRMRAPLAWLSSLTTR